MGDLNRELQEYLARNDSKVDDKEALLPTSIKDIKIPKLTSWFNRNGSVEDDETSSTSSVGSSSTWFASGQSDPFCPSLVRILNHTMVWPILNRLHNSLKLGCQKLA